MRYSAYRCCTHEADPGIRTRSGKHCERGPETRDLQRAVLKASAGRSILVVVSRMGNTRTAKYRHALGVQLSACFLVLGPQGTSTFKTFTTDKNLRTAKSPLIKNKLGRDVEPSTLQVLHEFGVIVD